MKPTVFMTRRNCLICHQLQEEEENGTRNIEDYSYNYVPWKEFPIQKEEEEEDCLREQLWALFVLRKLLDLPRAEVEALLRNAGGDNPSTWIELCSECSALVNSAAELGQSIVKLERDLENVKMGIQRKLLSSWNACLELDEEEKPNFGVEGMITPVPIIHQVIRGKIIDAIAEKFGNPQGSSSKDSSGNGGWSKMDGNIESLQKLDSEESPSLSSGPEWTVKCEREEPISLTEMGQEEEEEEEVTVKRKSRRGRRRKTFGGKETASSRGDVDESYNRFEDVGGHDSEEHFFDISPSDLAHKNSDEDDDDGWTCERPKRRKRKTQKIRRPKTILENDVPSSQQESSVPTTCNQLVVVENPGRKPVSNPNPSQKLRKVYKRNFKCKLCAFASQCDRDIKRHQESHKYWDNIKAVEGSNNDFQCKLCNFVGRSGPIRAHFIDAHASQVGMDSFPCSLCQKMFVNEFNLKLHVRRVHGGGTKKDKIKRWSQPAAVKNAGRKPKDKAKATSGTKKKKKVYKRNFKCNLCEFASQSVRDISRHQESHKYRDNIEAIQGSKDFQCKLCDFAGRAGPIRAHFVDNHASQVGMETFLCHLCERVFVSELNLNVHIRDVHGDAGDGGMRYTCQICGAGFSRLHKYTYHYRKCKNGGKSSRMCDHCGVTYATERVLKQHLEKFHTGENPNKSEGSGGDGGGAHSDEPGKKKRPTKCKHCGDQMLHNTALKLHFRTAHPQLFTYTCDECDAAYMTPGGLKTHQAAKHSNQRMSCPHCHKEFSCAAYLSTHLKDHCKHIPATATSSSAEKDSS